MATILLTGMPGAGKEEFLNVAREEGYDVIRMGDVVREHAEKKDISFEDSSLGSFAHDEREKHHEGIWADRTLCDITEDKTIIDGVRSTAEVSIFKSELGDLHIVAIHASPKTRFERLKERGREDAPESWSEFNDRDNRELNWGLSRVISRADHMIINESSLKDFYSKVRDLLKELN